MSMIALWRTLLSAPAAALVFLYQPAPAHAEADVLERPALMSDRAEKSVMLGIARAGERLVAVGERGIILLSDDAGSTWRQADVPVSVSLTQVAFAGSQKGWAVGHSGIVLHTANGGESWQMQLDGRQLASLAVEAARQQGGDALAEAERLVADGPDKPLLDVHFFDEQHGLVVGAYGIAFDTRNGGQTWESLGARIDGNRGMHLYAILQVDGKVYLAGEQGSIFRSDDRGLTFAPLESPYAGSYFGLVKGTTNEVIAFGMRGNAFWSANSGDSWNRSEIPVAKSLVEGHTALGRVLLVNDDGDLLESRDGGRTFSQMKKEKLPPLTGVIEGNEHTLIATGVRGVTRVELGANGRAVQ